jgi:ParB/RepB/Spo0J family partition protein
MYEIIPADKLVPAEDNVRRNLGSLKELTASIAAVGVIEPLVVTPRGDGTFLVVAGHRRLAAGSAAGLSDFPCVIREMDDIDRLVTGLVENLSRSDLNVMDEAAGLFRLVEYGLSVSALAKRLGRSAKHVSGRLALLELPKAAQGELQAGRISVGEATALLALRHRPDAIDALLADEYSRGDIERAVVRETARIEAETKAAEARASVEAAGVTIVDEWTRYGGNTRSAVALGNNHGELPIDVEAHRDETCHAAHIARGGDVIWLCTDPTRHRPGGDSTVAAPSDAPPTPVEAKSADRELSRARVAAARERTAFIAELLRRRLPKGDAADLTAHQMLTVTTANQARSACDLLRLEPVPDRFGPDHRAALAGFAAESNVNRDRALLALALAAGEERVRLGARDDSARRHVAFLQSFGYEVPAEVAELLNEKVEEPPSAA